MEYSAKTDIHSAIHYMAAASHKTYAQISRELGRARNFLSVLFRDGATPRLDLMAKIANACGYVLLLVGHGEALEVVPEPCEGSPCTVEKRYNVAETPAGLVLGTDAATPYDTAPVAPAVALDDAARQALMDAGADALLGDLIEYLGGKRQALQGGADPAGNND